MKNKILVSLAALCAFLFVGCATTTQPGTVTSTQQTVANAVEDALSIGLVPVFTKNFNYIPAAQAIASSLALFTGDTITPADVNALLATTSLTDEDRKIVAAVVNSAWSVYSRRYAQLVGNSTRPDVKLFLSATSNGILQACAAVAKG